MNPDDKLDKALERSTLISVDVGELMLTLYSFIYPLRFLFRHRFGAYYYDPRPIMFLLIFHVLTSSVPYYFFSGTFNDVALITNNPFQEAFQLLDRNIDSFVNSIIDPKYTLGITYDLPSFFFLMGCLVGLTRLVYLSVTDRFDLRKPPSYVGVSFFEYIRIGRFSLRKKYVIVYVILEPALVFLMFYLSGSLFLLMAGFISIFVGYVEATTNDIHARETKRGRISTDPLKNKPIHPRENSGGFVIKDD